MQSYILYAGVVTVSVRLFVTGPGVMQCRTWKPLKGLLVVVLQQRLFGREELGTSDGNDLASRGKTTEKHLK